MSAEISTAVFSQVIIPIWNCLYRSLEIAVKLDGVEIGLGIVDVVYKILCSADEIWKVECAEGRVDWTSQDGNGVQRHGVFHFWKKEDGEEGFRLIGFWINCWKRQEGGDVIEKFVLFLQAELYILIYIFCPLEEYSKEL